ncbi:MAG: copper resistance protein CopD [Methylococcus sp.]|nr:MAG: copper resistance protein CopD [Methylococcus sp.]
MHILTATVWTGGHLVLALTYLPQSLRAKDVGAIQSFEQRFEPIGLPALVLQIATGLWLAYAKQPDWGQWFGFSDPISSLIFIKLILSGLTLGLAVHAGLKLIPHLSPATLPALAWHIASVTVLSVAFVLVGVGLPFRWILNLTALTDSGP